MSGKMKKNNKNEKNRTIKPQNYFYSILILVVGIFLTLYIFKWYQIKKEQKLMTSYLLSSNTIESAINDFDTLEQVIQESPSSYFIYLSYTGNERIYNFERKLKALIDNYKLNDAFYYVDLTNLMKNNSNYLDIIMDKLTLKNIKSLPIIIYVNEGSINEDNILGGNTTFDIKISEFENLLKSNGFNTIK